MHETERNLTAVNHPQDQKVNTEDVQSIELENISITSGAQPKEAVDKSNVKITSETVSNPTANAEEHNRPLLAQDYGTFVTEKEDPDQEIIRVAEQKGVEPTEVKQQASMETKKQPSAPAAGDEDNSHATREMAQIQIEVPDDQDSDKKLASREDSDKKSISSEEDNLLEEKEEIARTEKKEVDPHERDQSKVVVLPDGRSLAFSQYGDLTSRNVILLIPPVEGVRVFGRWFDVAASSYGCRLLCPDRPGFGFSHPLPSRGFSDFSEDLHTLLSVLHIKKVVVIGHSAGSVYAAGFATAYPKSVKAVGLMAPWAPLNSAGFPCYCQCGHYLRCCTGQIAKTILQDHVAAFHASDPQLTEEEQEAKRQARIEQSKAARRALPCPKRCCKETSYYIGYCIAWIRFFISWTCWAIQTHCCKKREPLEGESAVVQTKEYQDTNRAIVRELFRQGPAPLSYELKLCMRRGSQRKLFGYSYSDIPHPVTVFVALHDKMTHPNVGRSIASSIPGANLVEFPDSSHIMFVQQEVTDKIVRAVLKSVPDWSDDEHGEDESEEQKKPNSLSVRQLNGGGLRVSL